MARWVFNFAKWQPTRSDILLASACIQSEEKERLSRFVFKKDFKSSLVGRLLMRKFVHEVTSYPYKDIKFDRDEKGKPILVSPNAKLAFNVSHHGNYVVFAGDVGINTLGIDVMKLEYRGGKTLEEFFRIMKRQFSDLEWVTIRNSGCESNQIAMFCRHWCLKESYVKAVGVGITVNLQDISFKINSEKLSKGSIVADSELYVESIKKDWHFEEMLIDEEHCIAVATPNDEKITLGDKLPFTEIDFNEVIKNVTPLDAFDDIYCTLYFEKLDA